jgi:hypothetical protein
LASVVYRVGASGPWSCACRELSNSYWYFKDALKPTLLPDVANVFGKYVVLLMYVRSDFAARLGQISSVPRVDRATSGTGEAGKQPRRGTHSVTGLDAPGDQEMDAMRSYFEGLGIGGGCTERRVVPQTAGFMVEASGEARGKVMEMSSYAWRLWSDGATFLDVLFGEDSARELLADISKRTAEDAGVSANERGFLYLAEQCKAMALTRSDFLEYRAWRHQEEEKGLLKAQLAQQAERVAQRERTHVRKESMRIAKDAASRRSDRNSFENMFSGVGSSSSVSSMLGGASDSLLKRKGSSSRLESAGRTMFGVLPRVVSGGSQGSRVDIEPVGGKRASSSVRGNGELRELGSRLKRRARSRGCGKDGRSHGRVDARQEGDSILSSKLGRQLVALGAEREVVEAILAYMLYQFGDRKAWQLVDDDDGDWLLVWDRWVAFASELQELRVTWDCEACLFLDHVKHLLQELLFALFRVVDAQAPVTDVTNDDRLAELEARGFSKRNGQVWGENDCLADSLLQLLISSNVVPEGVDRELACKQNRWNLERQPALVPRTRSGRKDLGGMLQHHRHATATLHFFFWIGFRVIY